jgi:hypothetical protein
MAKIEHAPVVAVENPETRTMAFPWMTSDGYLVEASGAVEGCGCDRCESRREEAVGNCGYEV